MKLLDTFLSQAFFDFQNLNNAMFLQLQDKNYLLISFNMFLNTAGNFQENTLKRKICGKYVA